MLVGIKRLLRMCLMVFERWYGGIFSWNMCGMFGLRLI